MSFLLNVTLVIVGLAGVLWLLSPRLLPSLGTFLVKMDLSARVKKAEFEQKSFVLPDGRGAWYLERVTRGHAEDKPLVILPGLGVTMHLMGAQLGDVLKHIPNRRVIVIELPYHGRCVSMESDFRDPGLALDAITASIAMIVDNIGGLESFDLMGYSFGGVLATNLVLKHPQRVGKVMLLAPYYYNEATTEQYNVVFEAKQWHRLAAWQGRDELEPWFYNWLGLDKNDALPGFIFSGIAGLRAEQYPDNYWVGFYNRLHDDCQSSRSFLAENNDALGALSSEVLLIAASNDTIVNAEKLTQLSNVFNSEKTDIKTVNAGHFFAPNGQTLFEVSADEVGAFLNR
ncbi:MAG TPA: alpha/beta hydrolase [Candidatus Poseidoniales archaeon]|nr:MAG TPA: alpha/beta hydrolase [Candidatus Poseidoniales archaeon]